MLRQILVPDRQVVVGTVVRRGLAVWRDLPCKCRSRGEAKRRRGEKESLALLNAPEIYGIFQLCALEREGPSPAAARRSAWVAGNGDALTELRCRKIVARPKELAREKHTVDLGACRNHDRLVHLAGAAENGIA